MSVRSTVMRTGLAALSAVVLASGAWAANEKLKIGFVGVYLDGIGYDRIGMMRLARMLTAGGADYYLPFHSGDDFKNPWCEWHAPPAVAYLEHLPYVTQLMFGEVFWYDGPEGYWMTNLAGLPFGIDNQFYPVPGPDYPFRVMLYASPDLLWDAEDALQPLGTRAQVFTDTQMIVEQVLLTAKPGDYVLVMSNGGFENIHQRLLDALAMSNMFTLSSHTTTHSM